MVPKRRFSEKQLDLFEISQSTELPNEEKLEKKRQEILSRVSSYQVPTLRDKVAWILNNFPETRDSDRRLHLRYWKNFDTELYSGENFNEDTYMKLTSPTSLTRERAKLQNVYKLFLASPEIREKRGTLSEEEKVKAIEDRPKGLPVDTVYLDESGKNSNYLIVGGVWFISEYQTIYSAVADLKKRHKFETEFHFKNMRDADLPIYKELVETFLEFGNYVSFVLLSAYRKGSKLSEHDALFNLYYHLLNRGIEHNNQTGRAPLPRLLQVWLDAESILSDQIMLANLCDRLKQTSTTLFNRELYLDKFYPVSSRTNLMLQMADLLVASSNRIKNQPGEKRTCKDEFAEFLLSRLHITFDPSEVEEVGDMAVYSSL